MAKATAKETRRMTWVCKRGSRSGAALTLISKDDLIDDEEPTVGDSDSTHRHLLREALIPINDDEFWEGFLQHVNSVGRRQESNPGDSILESADDFKSNLAVDDEGNEGENPLWSVIVKVKPSLLHLFSADLLSLAMRNIPSFASFVALLTRDFLPTSKYELSSGSLHNLVEFFLRLLHETMLPGFVMDCPMSFHPKFPQCRSPIPARCCMFLIPLNQKTMAG